MLIIRLLFIHIVLFSPLAHAIVNIEALRMDEKEPGWTSQISLSMNGKKGNTDKDAASLGLGVQLVKPQFRTFLIGSGEYGRSDGVVDDEEYFLHLRHTHYLNKELDWEIFTQYESQPFVHHNQRTLVGAGLRTEAEFLGFIGHAGLGLMHEKESVENSNQIRLHADTNRFNAYADLKYRFSSQSNWVGVIYYQPKIDDFNDHQYVISTGVDAKVIDPVSLAFDITHRYDARPLGDLLKPRDLSYNFSINIEF